MSNCNNTELLRDYAFDELPSTDRPAFERHLHDCAACTAELDQLRLTTAALRILPDAEPPQRIAFVSDKVFAPSRLWNLAPWFGFASAAVMAAALLINIYYRPVETRTIAVQSAPAAVDQAALKNAVSQAVAQTQAQDALIFKAALEASDRKHEQRDLNLVDAIHVLQAHQDTNTLMAGNTEPAQNGVGQ
jgi:anti-sigma factor RsiW